MKGVFSVRGTYPWLVIGIFWAGKGTAWQYSACRVQWWSLGDKIEALPQIIVSLLGTHWIIDAIFLLSVDISEVSQAERHQHWPTDDEITVTVAIARRNLRSIVSTAFGQAPCHPYRRLFSCRPLSVKSDDSGRVEWHVDYYTTHMLWVKRANEGIVLSTSFIALIIPRYRVLPVRWTPRWRTSKRKKKNILNL